MPTTDTRKKKKTRRQMSAKAPSPVEVDWSKPITITTVDLAFPAHVIGRLLPPIDDIPDSMKGSPWKNIAETWFYSGLSGRFIPKPGIDMATAARQLSACLGSYQPKHEDKIAGVAYLMSLWFDDFEPTSDTREL